MRDVSLDVDVAINDLGRVEVTRRQRQQLRPLALVTLERRFAEVAQAADVGDLRQPPRGHVVEMR